MGLHYIDWIVIALYGVLSVVVGLWYSKRAGQGLEQYFVAGRTLPWWLAGTSIAATYFATDAPLAAASLVRKHGIFANWLWWYESAGLMLVVFFYAKLWRRANILTDAEFIELRYSGKPASILRAFTAIYHGLIKNLIVMGWVLLAMMKFSQVILGFDPIYTLTITVTLALVYTIMSGLWGVVFTDLLQFVTGILGSIIFAGIVLYEVGGPSEMVTQIQAMSSNPAGTLDIFPDSQHISSVHFASMFILIFVLWTRVAQGDGYIVQRLFAAKDERHSLLAALWFNFSSMVLMTWPWIIVGLGSLIILPIATATPELLADPELAYPMMIMEVVPIGLTGVLIASFLAAFMSTMDTHLCWGSSYLINDIYKRFLKPEATDRHYVAASRWSILLLAILASFAAWQMDSIERGWVYIIEMTSGIAFVGLLRWFWWRINPWAEISAMIASVILANTALLLDIIQKLGMISTVTRSSLEVYYSSEYDMIRALIILLLCTIVWIVVVLWSKPDDKEHLAKFYKKVRPGGWWAPIAEANPEVKTDTDSRRQWMGWALGVTFIYTSLLGIGYIVTDRMVMGTILTVASLGAGYLMLRLTKNSKSE